MTDRELMQQALDAMLNNPDDISDEMFESIKTLKERLAQANEFEPDWDVMAVMVEEQQRMAKRIEELEAQQKPWVKTYAGGKPHYTVPEERPRHWQELTDEDVNTIWRDIDGSEGLLMRFARAIEARLREKNT